MGVSVSPGKGLEVIPCGFRLLAALAQTLAVQSEDLLLQTRQAGHDYSSAYVSSLFTAGLVQEVLLQLR